MTYQRYAPQFEGNEWTEFVADLAAVSAIPRFLEFLSRSLSRSLHFSRSWRRSRAARAAKGGAKLDDARPDGERLDWTKLDSPELGWTEQLKPGLERSALNCTRLDGGRLRPRLSHRSALRCSLRPGRRRGVHQDHRRANGRARAVQVDLHRLLPHHHRLLVDDDLPRSLAVVQAQPPSREGAAELRQLPLEKLGRANAGRSHRLRLLHGGLRHRSVGLRGENPLSGDASLAGAAAHRPFLCSGAGAPGLVRDEPSQEENPAS
eukprot:scaffold1712_cov261-Pinguiococcus_pyrenoidosus.AAC.14